MALSATQLREKLISAGVRNLRQFGYPGCNKGNITTDKVYRQFFASMLREAEGDGKGTAVDAVVTELLMDCES